MHEFLNVVIRTLIFMILFEACRMLWNTWHLFFVIRNLKNCFMVVRFLLKMEFLSSVKQGKKVVVPCGALGYPAKWENGYLNIAGIHLKLEKDFNIQLQKLVDETKKMIVEKSNEIFLKSRLLKHCAEIEKMIPELQQLLEQKTQKGVTV